MNRQVVRELIEDKMKKVQKELPDGESWSFYFAVFGRAGFTPAAAELLAEENRLAIDLEQLDAGLNLAN